MSTKARIDFSDCLEVRTKTHSTEWYERIIFYDFRLWGRNFGAGPGDVELAKLEWNDECGTAPVVKLGAKGRPLTFGRFDIIVHDNFERGGI